MVTTMILLIIGMLLAFLAGAWTTHRAYQNQPPLPDFLEGVVLDDIPPPISPFEEGRKSRLSVLRGTETKTRDE